MTIQSYNKYSDGIIYVIFTAISFVFIDKLGSYINPIVSLFYLAIFATIWFHIINIHDLKKMYMVCLTDYKYFIMAIAIGVNWLSSIFAPHYSDPFIYLSIYFIVLGICGFGFSYLREHKINYLISIGGLITALVFIYFFYVIDNGRNMTIGIVLGITGGISAYIYARLSGIIIAKSKLTTSQLLAIRFIPLCILLSVIIKVNHIAFSQTFSNYVILLIMAIISLITPIYFYQKAIVKLGAEKSSIIVACAPVFTFILFTLATNKLVLNNLIVSAIVLLALLLPQILNKINNV